MGTTGQNIRRLRELNEWTQQFLSKKLGVSQSSFSQWEKDEYKPKLEQLTKLADVFNVSIVEIDESLKNVGDSKIIPMSEFKLVPLLNAAQAKEISGNKSIDIEDGEMVPFINPKDGDFAVIITGNSMEPWYPHGTRVLVRKEIPKNYDRVVACIPDQKDLVFKVYLDLGDKFALWSVNQLEGMKPLVIDKMDREAFVWVYPIKESLRVEKDVDMAMLKHGIHHGYEEWLSQYKKQQKEEQ